MAQNFITAVACRGDALEWTTLKLVKNQSEVAEYKTAPLEGGAAALAKGESGDVLKAACGHLKGLVYVAIPSDRALMRVVDLPTTDLDEMKGMVELQVDKFSPFPVEHMSVSFETLSKKETSSRVVIAAVQREIVDGLGASFQKAGVLPHGIDIDVMGWWHVLRERGELPETGRKAVLILDPNGAELVISEDGVPVVIRSLGTAAGVTEDEFYAELADEMGYTLTALEAERGVAAGGSLSLWCFGGAGAVPPREVLPGAEEAAVEAPAAGAPAVLVEKLREVLGQEPEVRDLATLPSLSEGLARRALAGGALCLNLAPPEWRSTEHTRHIRKTLLIATGAFLGAWLLGLGLFFGGLQIQRGRLAALKAEVGKLEGPAEEVRDLTSKVESFELYADRSHSALEALREVSELLPEGVDLTSFSYKKGGQVSLRGECAAPDPIYDFFQGLEQSAFFEKVKPGDVRSKMVGPTQKSEFTVTADMPGLAGSKDEGEEPKP
jgi:Tfp pilus assembly protein PilN